MLRTILFLAALIGTTSSAETLGTVQPATFNGIFPSNFECHKVDGRAGWQRLDTSGYGVPVIYPIGPKAAVVYKLTGPDSAPGWTVDAARYDAVGPKGHLGDAAAALEPYDTYKFSRKPAFGALLVRLGQSDLFHLFRTDASTSLEAHQPWVDFRINDTGLGDNAGYLIVCVSNLSDLE